MSFKNCLECVLNKLEGTTIQADWQLEVAPKELLLQTFPDASQGAEFTYVLRVQKETNKNDGPSIAREVHKFGKVVKRERRRKEYNERDGSVDSDSSDETF